MTHLGERGIELRSIKEHSDTTTPTGKLMFHMVGAMAEFERDIIRERTTAGLEAARALGRKGGRPKVTETIKPRSLALAKDLYTAREKSVAQIMEQSRFKSCATFSKICRGYDEVKVIYSSEHVNLCSIASPHFEAGNRDKVAALYEQEDTWLDWALQQAGKPPFHTLISDL